MKLIIGNATRQVYEFQYRMLETLQLRIQKIPPLGQTALTGDLTGPEIDFILKQHTGYGLIAEDRIDQSREFHGICYSIDKPITATRLQYLFKSNINELVKRGEEIRRVNAVAHERNINSMLTQSDAEQIPVLELTIQQENEDPKNDVAQLSQGILVSSDGNAQPVGNRGPGRPRKVA